MKILDRAYLEQLIFGSGIGRRFTQDSPILPDVWLAYGQKPDARIDLLITPYRDLPPGKLAQNLRVRFSTDHPNKGGTESKRADIVYIQSTVAARFTFIDMIRVVLPLTSWWKHYVLNPKAIGGNLIELLEQDIFKQKMITALATLSAQPDELKPTITEQGLAPEFVWMAKLIGTICMASEASSRKKFDPKPEELYVAFQHRMRGVPPANEVAVFSVSLNRPATTTVWRSTLAVKADAARLLFNISCRDLAWAIIDSGVDARHRAFRLRTPAPACALMEPEFIQQNGNWVNNTRVIATYNFVKFRDLLTIIGEHSPGTPTPGGLPLSDAEIQALQYRLQQGGSPDWALLEPILRVPHTTPGYVAPRHEHGTHVAGILAGDCRIGELTADAPEDLQGVCPDIRLYDLRVLDDNGQGDELSIMAALNFLRYLNSVNEFRVIHGANLSLSLRHDVANYACGVTPVCEECDRVINSGVVVVAAAGNQGYMRFSTADGPAEGYRSVSITDPGNTENVITVGATHSLRPHTYGVSYFSSRGPTGDGRIKPDLVAPGEKITSVIPGQSAMQKDGTSMAAPHVSGAAALLMARNREMIGNPRRIKKILCDTATDLGREPYFQGCGMVDVLRAIQSI